jgi:hypothetical protein
MILTNYKFITEGDIIGYCTSDGQNLAGNEIYLYDISMDRTSGYGQYKLYVTIKINGYSFKFTKHSTNSELFDQLKYAEGKEKEMLLEEIFKEVMTDRSSELLEIEEEILKGEE